jgi:4-amino-4-deoxy-L-arabinose transferase-like glycosyltransferase
LRLPGALLFIPFLGAVHLFDWDEINFAESAREMLVSGNYSRVQIDYQPFWEKPPLFFWMQALSMQLFGVNELAARLPNAITGIATLLTFFFIGKKIKDERLGLLWAICMAGSFLPHLYFKSGIIDPVFNYFIFLGIYCLSLLVSKRGEIRTLQYAALTGLFIGLATLTKGPVAFLILLLTLGAYWATVRLRSIMSFRSMLVFSICFIVTAGIWFVVDIRENGIDFLWQFVKYQVELLTQPVAGHGEPFYYHFIVVLVGCFPMSIIALPQLFKSTRNESDADFRRWMLLLFWVVMILFSIVKTKIVHYSSLTYFPLSFLAACAIYSAGATKKDVSKLVNSRTLHHGKYFFTTLNSCSIHCHQ